MAPSGPAAVDPVGAGSPAWPPPAWSPPAHGPLRMVVLGDSTAFTDHRGPQLPDDPALYPNVAARRLAERLARDVTVTVVAQPGNAVRHVARTVTKDRHVMFEVLLGADLVVLGFGGFDHAPAGVPPAVEAVVPFLRPARLRRRVRRTLRAAYPWLVRGTAYRFRRTPTPEFERLFTQVLVQVRGLTRGAAGVVVGPTSHRARYYGGRDPRFRPAEARQLALARAHGYAAFSAWDLVAPHLDDLNVDGIHWPHRVHAAVGRRVADALAPQVTGEADPPGLPGRGP